MDRVLNRRYVLGAAICLCAGAVLGGVLTGRLVWQIIVPIVLAAVGILLLCFKRKFLFFAVFSVALGVAILSADCAVGQANYREGYYLFEGRVWEVTDGYVTFDEAHLDGEKTGGRVRGRRSDFSTAYEGDVVSVFVKIEPIEVDFFARYSSGLFNDRVYNEITPYGEYAVVGRKRTITEKIRDRIAGPLYRYCDDGDAGIAESLLFGDKSNLAETDEELIEGIGMSHVFAVSGLHVGFLTAVFVFLLRKLRVNRYAQIGLTAAVLLLYGFLTGFPAGLKRAAIMALLYLAAPVVRGKPDALTALGAACYLIALTNPREVFDLGFLMSVSAVCGILLFCTPISKALRKVIRPRALVRVCDGVALTISANLLLLPVLTDVFGRVAPYAPLANVLLLPLVTVSYVYIAVVALLTAIIPSSGILFCVVKYPFGAIRGISDLLYSLPYSTVSVGAIGAFWVLYLFGLLFLSKLNKLPYRAKIPLSAICILASAVGFFV